MGSSKPKQTFVIKRNGVESGPYTSRQLRDFALSGMIDSETLVRVADRQQWHVASKLAGLREHLSPSNNSCPVAAETGTRSHLPEADHRDVDQSVGLKHDFNSNESTEQYAKAGCLTALGYLCASWAAAIAAVFASAAELSTAMRITGAIAYALFAAICIRPSWEFLQRSLPFLRHARRRYVIAILLFVCIQLTLINPRRIASKPLKETSPTAEKLSSNPHERYQQLKERERRDLKNKEDFQRDREAVIERWLLEKKYGDRE